MEEEQVVSGKLGRQIMNMAREQQEALEDGEDGGGDSDDDDDEDTMQWRESQMYFFFGDKKLTLEMRKWKILTTILMKRNMMKNMTPRK